MKLRNHFTYIFEQMWGIILVVIAVLLSSDDSLGWAARSFRWAMQLFSQGHILKGLLVLCSGVIIFILICLWYINRWYKTTITIADGTVTFERRTLNRYVNAIAVQNISNINLEQNLFEILVGTYKLKLDTNSLSTANATDVTIVLKKKDAYAVKNRIMEMMKEARLEQEAAADADSQVSGLAPEKTVYDIDMMEDWEEREYDVCYSTKEIVVNCLVNTSIILFVLSIAFFVAAIYTAVTAILAAKGFLAAFGAFLVQLLLAGSMITALIKNWLNDFNFRANRYQDKIYVSCGLIKRKKYAVPVDKINAVSFQYTFLGRIFKRATVKVINVGGEDEDVDGMKILLAGTQQKLREQLAVLLPEFAFPDQELLARQPDRVLYTTALCTMLSLSVLSGVLYLGVRTGMSVFNREMPTFVGWIWIAATCGVVVLVEVLSVLSYLEERLYVGRSELMIAHGMFAKSVCCIPYDKIQYISCMQGPVEHLLQVSHARISILASTFSQNQLIGAFPNEEYERLHDKLRQTYINQRKTLG